MPGCGSREWENARGSFGVLFYETTDVARAAPIDEPPACRRQPPRRHLAAPPRRAARGRRTTSAAAGPGRGASRRQGPAPACPPARCWQGAVEWDAGPPPVDQGQAALTSWIGGLAMRRRGDSERRLAHAPRRAGWAADNVPGRCALRSGLARARARAGASSRALNAMQGRTSATVAGLATAVQPRVAGPPRRKRPSRTPARTKAHRAAAGSGRGSDRARAHTRPPLSRNPRNSGFTRANINRAILGIPWRAGPSACPFFAFALRPRRSALVGCNALGRCHAGMRAQGGGAPVQAGLLPHRNSPRHWGPLDAPARAR
jgi:hypothetical protein